MRRFYESWQMLDVHSSVMTDKSQNQDLSVVTDGTQSAQNQIDIIQQPLAGEIGSPMATQWTN